MSFHRARKRSVYGLPPPLASGACAATGTAAGPGDGGAGAAAATGAGAGAGALPSSRTIGWSVAGCGAWAPADWALGSTQDPKMATATAAPAAIAAVKRRSVMPALLADELQIVDVDVVVGGRDVDLELDAVDLRRRDVR